MAGAWTGGAAKAWATHLARGACAGRGRAAGAGKAATCHRRERPGPSRGPGWCQLCLQTQGRSARQARRAREVFMECLLGVKPVLGLVTPHVGGRSPSGHLGGKIPAPACPLHPPFLHPLPRHMPVGWTLHFHRALLLRLPPPAKFSLVSTTRNPGYLCRDAFMDHPN